MTTTNFASTIVSASFRKIKSALLTKTGVRDDSQRSSKTEDIVLGDVARRCSQAKNDSVVAEQCVYVDETN